MDISPVNCALGTHSPIFVRTLGQVPKGVVVKDWTTINRDISPRPDPASAPASDQCHEDPERWDGMG